MCEKEGRDTEGVRRVGGAMGRCDFLSSVPLPYCGPHHLGGFGCLHRDLPLPALFTSRTEPVMSVVAAFLPVPFMRIQLIFCLVGCFRF